MSLTLKDNNILAEATLAKYPLFSLKGLITYAKLLSNYDGDTGDIIFIYNSVPMRMKARFMGYDTCEMKPLLKDPKRDEKKQRALDAKKCLWFLCTNTDEFTDTHTNIIKIKCYEFDKYGRLLILAFNQDLDIQNMDEKTQFDYSINAIMIKEGHGYVYEGGTKNNDF